MCVHDNEYIVFNRPYKKQNSVSLHTSVIHESYCVECHSMLDGNYSDLFRSWHGIIHHGWQMCPKTAGYLYNDGHLSDIALVNHSDGSRQISCYCISTEISWIHLCKPNKECMYFHLDPKSPYFNISSYWNSNRIVTCANGKYKFENVSIGIMNDSLKVIGITNLIVTTLNIVVFSWLFLYILRNKVSMGVYSITI